MKSTVRQILVFLIITGLSACSKTDEAGNKSLLPAGGNETTGSPNREQRSSETQTLIQAVQKTGAKSVDGKLVPRICEIATPHLDYMIEKNKISHDGYDDRTERLYAAGGTGSGEIVAYNCSGGMTIEKGASSCANSWLNSPGHWALMKKKWDGFCYAMKRTGSCYYCIGLFSNGSW